MTLKDLKYSHMEFLWWILSVTEFYTQELLLQHFLQHCCKETKDVYIAQAVQQWC